MSSIESNISSERVPLGHTPSTAMSQSLKRNRKLSIESGDMAPVDDMEEVRQESKAKSVTAPRAGRGPYCLPLLARQWSLPLDCIQAAAELFAKHAVMPGLAKDEDILRDGRLTNVEMQQVIMDLAAVTDSLDVPPELALDAQREADKNKDGIVNFQEFASWYQHRAFMTYVNLTRNERKNRETADKLGISSAEMDHFKAMFQKFDLKHCGTIDQLQFNHLMHALMKVPPHLVISNHRIKYFWQACDKDGVGHVDFEEFVTFYNNNFDKDADHPMQDYYKSIRRIGN